MSGVKPDLLGDPRACVKLREFHWGFRVQFTFSFTCPTVLCAGYGTGWDSHMLLNIDKNTYKMSYLCILGTMVGGRSFFLAMNRAVQLAVKLSANSPIHRTPLEHYLLFVFCA